MRLYVGNLSTEVTEGDLTELFGTAGTVVSATVVTDRDRGKSRGFAFVQMASEPEGERALERFNGYELKGRPMVVNEARPLSDGSFPG